MMKPKVALIKAGFLPPDAGGKGRLSADGIAKCKELAAAGWEIEGYQVSKSSVSTAAPVVEKVKTDPNRLVDVPEPSRLESDLTAWVGTKEIGMRTVCNNCRCSLTYCRCEQPRVWLDHEQQGLVHFKPVKR